MLFSDLEKLFPGPCLHSPPSPGLKAQVDSVKHGPGEDEGAALCASAPAAQGWQPRPESREAAEQGEPPEPSRDGDQEEAPEPQPECAGLGGVDLVRSPGERPK